MSVFSDAIVASLKADEVPAAQMIENLLISVVQELPLLLPVQYQVLVEGLDAAILPAVKAFLDAKIAALPVVAPV